MFNPHTTETIIINGAEVELQWGDRDGYGKDSLGVAVSTCATSELGYSGPSDGESFELRGKHYQLGQHDYSTDQPGNEDDEECTCEAEIFAVHDDQMSLSL